MTEHRGPSEAEPQIQVLVIDDEEIVHRSVGKILARAGYHADAVFSAKEGLQRLQQRPFELVITDLMMPEMNGIELLRAMRELELQVPVIMITGYPTIRTALQAMRFGARDYLAKPFTRKELLSPVKRALRQRQGGGEAQPAADQGSASRVVEAGALQPGARVYLPHHSWAEFRQDGHFLVGVEASFLDAVGTVSAIEFPDALVGLDQGTVGVRLITAEGEDHGIAMPLSGQVVEVNPALREDPASLTAENWLLKMLPSQLEGELANLILK